MLLENPWLSECYLEEAAELFESLGDRRLRALGRPRNWDYVGSAMPKNRC